VRCGLKLINIIEENIIFEKWQWYWFFMVMDPYIIIQIV